MGQVNPIDLAFVYVNTGAKQASRCDAAAEGGALIIITTLNTITERYIDLKKHTIYICSYSTYIYFSKTCANKIHTSTLALIKQHESRAIAGSRQSTELRA